MPPVCVTILSKSLSDRGEDLRTAAPAPRFMAVDISTMGSASPAGASAENGMSMLPPPELPVAGAVSLCLSSSVSTGFSSNNISCSSSANPSEKLSPCPATLLADRTNGVAELGADCIDSILKSPGGGRSPGGVRSDEARDKDSTGQEGTERRFRSDAIGGASGLPRPYVKPRVPSGLRANTWVVLLRAGVAAAAARVTTGVAGGVPLGSSTDVRAGLLNSFKLPAGPCGRKLPGGN